MKIEKIFELAGLKKTQELEQDLKEIVHYTEFLDQISVHDSTEDQSIFLELRKDIPYQESFSYSTLAPRRKKNLIEIPLVQDV